MKDLTLLVHGDQERVTDLVEGRVPSVLSRYVEEEELVLNAALA